MVRSQVQEQTDLGVCKHVDRSRLVVKLVGHQMSAQRPTVCIKTETADDTAAITCYGPLILA